MQTPDGPTDALGIIPDDELSAAVSGGHNAVVSRARARFGRWPLGRDDIYDIADDLAWRLRRDHELAKAAGRFDLDDKRRFPDRFVPGDISALRALTAGHVFGWAMSLVDGDVPGAAPTAGYHLTYLLELATAPSFFLPAELAAQVLASEAPDRELVDQMRLPTERALISLGSDWRIDPTVHGDFLGQLRHEGRIIDVDAAVRAGELTGGISGLVAYADAEGDIADEVTWLRWVDTGEQRLRNCVHGRISRSTIAPLALNLLAAVSWASWRTPEQRLDLPDDPADDPRSWRKQTRRGVFRRREPEGGALEGLHIIDLDTTAKQADAHAEEDADASERKSPRAHLRRGHWRRVRVGPWRSGGDWHYEGRWIAPRLVGGRPDTDPGDIVYVLPPPE